MIKIWQRYFIFEFLKTFTLLILTFYGLYTLIDYASHTAGHIKPSWTQLALYYAFDFTKRMDVLIPFALLIATIRTICQLNIHNEPVAMMASGMSARRLMTPFIAIGLFFTCLMYINNQYILPHGLKTINAIGEKYSKERNKEGKKPVAKHFLLEDKTTVLFHDYDEANLTFTGVYWILNADEIYHIQKLDVSQETPIGHEVNHITRAPNGHLSLNENRAKKIFEEMPINKEQLFVTITPPDELALSILWQQIPKAKSHRSEKESQLITAFYKKLAMPWLCLLAVISPIPFCLRFTRTLQTFFIYAFGIFGLVAFCLVLDAAAVLGKRQALPPVVAIWVPLIFALSASGWRFLKSVRA